MKDWRLIPKLRFLSSTMIDIFSQVEETRVAEVALMAQGWSCLLMRVEVDRRSGKTTEVLEYAGGIF